MSTDITTDPFTVHLSTEDKAARARMWLDCPDWCTGANHEDGLATHTGPGAFVAHVGIYVEQPDGQDVGVKVHGEDWAHPLTLSQLDALIETLSAARQQLDALERGQS